jgi:hypothetical protein
VDDGIVAFFCVAVVCHFMWFPRCDSCPIRVEVCVAGRRFLSGWGDADSYTHGFYSSWGTSSMYGLSFVCVGELKSCGSRAILSNVSN